MTATSGGSLASGWRGFEFRVLGPLDVVSEGRVTEIGSLKQRALLALLVMNLNRTVSLDVIGDELWEGNPPASLSATVQSLVYRIRKLLAEAGADQAGVTLRGRGSGYVLSGEAAQVDANRFEELAAEGRRRAEAGDPDSAIEALNAALNLWRGSALADVADLPFARPEAARLEEAKLVAVEGLAGAELARGRPAAALELLEPHTAAHPLREAAWGQLMMALYRLGRQAEALRAFQQLRHVLADELGLDPNPELRKLESQILAQSPELDAAVPIARAPQPAPLQSRPGQTPLIGREAELDELRSALSDAMSGRGSLVMLAGEPGIGKTRLTEELAARAVGQNVRVLLGRCYEAEGTPPYVAIAEAFEDALATAPSPEAFRAALGDDAGEIARLVPRLRRVFADIPPALELPPEQERHYLFNSIRDTTARTAERIPVLIILEDLHWADEATLLLLAYMAGYLSEMAVLMVGTYRDVELPARPLLARTLDELLRQRRLRRIALRRLPEGDVARMLEAMSGQTPPAAVTGAVHAETDGNPFYMEEVYRHLVEEGRLLDDAGLFRADLDIGELDVPENVRLVIDRRLTRLSDDARRLLGAAAVIGRFFPFDLVEALAEGGSGDLLDTVEECERARLILTAAGGTRYLFSHELVRQTILAGLSTPRRCRLHLRVAEAMESLAGDTAEDHAADLAHHLVQGGSGADREKLLHYLIVAGRRSMTASAFEDGARHFDQALALGLARDRQEAELLEAAAKASRAVGRLDDAVALWQRSLQAYEALGDDESVGRVCYEASGQLGWATRWEQALAMTEQGLGVLPAEWIKQLDRKPATRTPWTTNRPAEQYVANLLSRCRLLSMRSTMLAASGYYAPALAGLDEGLELAGRLDDDEALGYVLSGKTCFHFCFMEHPAAIEAGRQAAALLRASGDVSQAAMTLGWTVVSLSAAGRWSEAASLAEELAPLAERLGNYPALLMSGRSAAMRDFFASGDCDRLQAFARRDIELNRKVGLGWAGMAVTWLGVAEFLRGRWNEALAAFRQGVEEEPPGVLDGTGSAFLLEELAYLGETNELAALLDKWEERLPRVGEPAMWGAWQMLFSVVEGLAVLGRRDAAGSYHPQLLDALETGTVVGNYHDGRLVERVAGIAAAAAGDWDRAEEHYSTALTQAAELPHVLEQLHTRLWYARMLLDRRGPGDKSRSAALLAEASEGYARLGMPRHRAMAEAAGAGT
jgi:DNA-binding SARP family transcriptional activator